MRVDIKEYPRSLSWEMKSFSMPNIPRGTSGMKENLRVILEMVKEHLSLTKIIHRRKRKQNRFGNSMCAFETNEIVVEGTKWLETFGRSTKMVGY